MAVVGFDDIDAASVHHPTLTTVATFPDQLGERAVKALLARISNPQAPLVKTRFEAQLFARETTMLWSRKAV